MIIGFVIGSTAEIFKVKILPPIFQGPSVVLWWVGVVVMSIIAFVLGF
jgi:hypothetical protein